MQTFFRRIPPAFLLFLALFAFFFFTASGNIDSIDGVTHYFLAKKIVTKGVIHFEPAEQKKLGMPVQINRADGKYYPIYNPGYALPVAPIIVANNTMRSVLSAPVPNWPLEPDALITFFANLVNGVAVAGVAVFIYRLSRLISPKNIPLLGGIVFIEILATNLVIQGHTHFAHALFALFFLASFEGLIHYNRTGERKWLVLFSLGILLTASVYNATFVFLFPAFCIYTLLAKDGERDKKWRRMVLIGVGFIPAILMQMGWNWMRFGGPLKTGYMEMDIPMYVFEGNRFVANFFGMTFGFNKGLFLNSPVIFLALVLAVLLNIKHFRLSHRGQLGFFLWFLIMYVCNYSLFNFWHGDESYGPRYLTPVLVMGLIYLNTVLPIILKSRFYKTLFIIFLGVGLLVQIPGLLIPNFSFVYLGPQYCQEYTHRYFNWRCAPVKVGWSHLIKRRFTETLTTTARPKTLSIEKTYPSPAKPFRTVYPDPLFDHFSAYKADTQGADKKMLNGIYSFTLDIWWIKARLFANIIKP